MLTAANRSGRNEEIEQQLVRLRHDAFGELSTGPGLAALPPEAPDPFPAVDFPEVHAGDFTAETLRSGILRHGCPSVRGLVPPKRVKQLTDDIEAAMNACEAWENDVAANTAPWFVPLDIGRRSTLGPEQKRVTRGGGVCAVDSPRAPGAIGEEVDVSPGWTAFCRLAPTARCSTCRWAIGSCSRPPKTHRSFARSSNRETRCFSTNASCAERRWAKR